MEEGLSVEQAFRAKRYFLKQFDERDHSENIAMLLRWTELDPTNGGVTYDPAQWHDWLAAIERARRG
jgi:hypothetical protein